MVKEAKLMGTKVEESEVVEKLIKPFKVALDTDRILGKYRKPVYLIQGLALLYAMTLSLFVRYDAAKDTYLVTNPLIVITSILVLLLVVFTLGFALLDVVLKLEASSDMSVNITPSVIFTNTFITVTPSFLWFSIPLSVNHLVFIEIKDVEKGEEVEVTLRIKSSLPLLPVFEIPIKLKNADLEQIFEFCKTYGIRLISDYIVAN